MPPFPITTHLLQGMMAKTSYFYSDVKVVWAFPVWNDNLWRDIPITRKIIFIVNVTVHLAHLNALYTHLNTITTKNAKKNIVPY